MVPDNARREHRHNVFLSATIERFGDKAPSRHRVRNISRSGACLDTAQSLVRGETVLVTLGDLECVGSTVRWVEGTRAGIQFATMIDIASATSRTVLKSARPSEDSLSKPRFTLSRPL